CNEILLFITYVFAGIPLFRHFLFFCRLREAGLLTLSRLVEVGPIQLDRSLLTALVDRWRSETHTFHLPCGGDDSYAAGRGLPPRPPYRRGSCRSACGGG